MPLAAPAIFTGARAATPRNIVAMAKQIDDIVGAFDPGESYEFSNNEVCGNLYRKLVIPDPAGGDRLVGDLAEKWEVSKDGAVFTFHIKHGVLFESGKPLTAEDVAFSLQRVVKMNKTPGFIITQFGLTADNVEQMVRVTSGYTLELKLPIVQATSFVLYCLSATVGCIVEKATVLANQANGDLGNAWLKMHSAGAGPYRLVEWKASDHIILETNTHAATKPRIPRVVIRHVADPSAQLLSLQKGDVDIARDLGSDQLKLVLNKPDYNVARIAQLTSMYIGMNTSVPQLQKVEARQALKTAIDYEAIAKNITPNLWGVWQSFLPKGIPGAVADNPFKKDVAKAKALLAKAGYPDGFSVTLDHFAKTPYPEIAQAVQAESRGDRSQGGAPRRRAEAGDQQDPRAPAADGAHHLVPGFPRCAFQRPGLLPEHRRFGRDQAEERRLALSLLRQGDDRAGGCRGQGARHQEAHGNVRQAAARLLPARALHLHAAEC